MKLRNDVTVDFRVPFAHPGRSVLHLSLYRPAMPADRPRPAVVLIHGGAWVGGTRFLKHWYAQELASQGIVAAAISYRKLPAHPFPACLHDAKAAVRWLREEAPRLGVDPSRIGAFGDSAGGHLALLLAMTRPEDGLEGGEHGGADASVQAAASLYGVADLADYSDRDWPLGRFPGTRLFFDAFLRGFGETPQAAMAAASPIRYIHPGVGPLLLMHGTKDPLVPVGQAQRLHAAARAAGVASRLEVFEERQHGFDYLRPSLRSEVKRLLTAFFLEALGEGPRNEAEGVAEEEPWRSSMPGPNTTT